VRSHGRSRPTDIAAVSPDTVELAPSTVKGVSLTLTAVEGLISSDPFPVLSEPRWIARSISA
jgi:hypothetical protein